MSSRTDEIKSLWTKKYGAPTSTPTASDSGMSDRQKELAQLWDKKFNRDPNVIGSNNDLGKWYESSSDVLERAGKFYDSTTGFLKEGDELQEIYAKAKKLTDGDPKGERYTGQRTAFLKKNGYSSLKELEKAIEKTQSSGKYDADYGKSYRDELNKAISGGESALAYIKAHKSDYENGDELVKQTQEYVQAMRDTVSAMEDVRDYFGQWQNEDEYTNGLSLGRTLEEMAKATGNYVKGKYESVAAQVKGSSRTTTTLGEDIAAARQGKTTNEYLEEVNAEGRERADELHEEAKKYYNKAASAESLAKWNKSTFGNWLVSAGIQIPEVAADAALNFAVGKATGIPGAGLVNMGIRAFGDASYQAREAGMEWDQAEIAGWKSAAVEIATEKLFSAVGKFAYGPGYLDDMVGRAIDGAVSNKGVKLVLKGAAAFGEEGLEEVMADVFNPALDYVLDLRDSEGNLLDEITGAQVLEDFIVGGIMGLAGTGGQAIISKGVQNGIENPKLKKIYDTAIEELIDQGLESDTDTDSYKLANEYQKALEKGKELSGAQIRKLIGANEEAIFGEDKAKIREATQKRLEQLGETSDVMTLAAAITKTAAGETLTKADREAIKGSRYGSRVVNELSASGIQGGTFASEWAEGIGTSKINAAEYGRINTEANEQISEELPAEVYEPMTYDEQEEFIRDKYSDAISEGILTEDNIQNIVKELKGGTPIESMVRRTDSYVKQQSTLREQEKSLRDRYAEAVKEGLLEQEDIDGLIDTLRSGTPAETLIQQTDEILEVLRDGKNGADGSLGRDSDDGAGESGGGVSEAAGRPEGQERRDDTGREEARGSDSKGNERKIPEKVSGRELKIPGGTDNKTMSVVKPSGIEARIVKAFMPAAKSITLVKGDIEQETKGGIVKVTGLETSDGRIWARMDHRMYSGTKLLLHECGHLYMRDDAELRRKMHEAAKQVMTEDAIDKLAAYYSKIWKGLYKLPEGVTYDTLGEHFDANPEALAEFLDTYQQEIWCDALAGLDRANAPGASKLTDAIRAVFLQETGIDIEGILNGTVAEETETAPAKGRAAEVEERETGPPVYSAEELDAEYADAVANNDMERAQELVDQAARAAGYTERLYHGTPNAQIKSADPVTYDDDGNVIPLIQRFNPRNEDIRYSADDTVTEEEVLRQKEVRRRANAMGLRNLRERVANLDGQIAGYERTEDRAENMERELEKLRADRGIYSEALTKKEAKSQQAKTDRRNAKEAAEKAVDELSVMRTTARARKILKKQIFDIYGIKHGFTEVGDSVDAFADTWIRQGKISYKAIEKMENMLMDLGEIRTESIDDHAREVRNRLSGGHISVPRSVVNEFSDDWDALRKRAFANGIYLSIDSHHTSIDQMTQDLAASFGKGRFDDSLSEKEQLENIIDIAEQGKAENLTVWQMAEYIAKMEGETASDYYIDDVHEQLMRSLKSFAQSAKIEMETVKRNVYNEVRRQTELKERMDRAQREREQREFQQKTLKQLRWLKRNQNFMGNDFQAEAKRILADIDTIAISAANEMNWSDKYQATWKDLAAMYKWAEKNDPNFLPSKELENIVMRVEGKHLDELSASALEDIYKAAVALRTAYYNRNNVIGDELHRQFAEVFDDSVADMKAAPKPKNKTGKGRNYLDQQLNPIHRINRMFGWKEESPGFQIFGRGLERGERLTKRYVEQATQMLDGWLTENEEWVRKSDGQGKEAIWYELEVPELMEFRTGDKPIFGKTVKVYMTPMQKIYLYLESKNYDNLRHIAGGRTFVNKELYSKGEYNEAFAQGTTVSLAPETVKKIVSDLTPTEMELANLLDKYFNGYAKTEINRVSNILYGYDRAMNDNYAPIFTNKNYNKSEPGIYQDGTAEGVGHMKTRAQGAKNPTYNISALDAFRRHVSQTSRFVGMAIPAQNATTLLNWSAGGVTMQDHITHNWNLKELTALENVMTELQAPTYQQESEFAGFLGKLMSKYIGGVFGANITVSAKVLASKATASIVLGGDAYPSIAQQRAVNDELVRKYTSELDVRIRGLGRPELAALTLDDSGYQKWVQSHKLTQLTLGGGLLQATDVYVARTLWAWSENRVRKDFPDLEVGTDEQVDAGMSPLYKKVAEVFDNAIGDTQSMYDIMHRSDIMRDTNELTRSFTIFHTDALQAINLVRMRAGKLTTAKANGSEATINTEAKGLAAAIAGAALMHAIAVLFDAIRDIWKKRLDDYKDDEGDFTFWSVTSEIIEQLAESMAGMLIGADAIIPAIEKKLKGETYYEHQLVAIDAFNDIIDGTGDFFKALGGFIGGFANVVSNGGDVWQYLTDDADFRGVVKDTAENIAHYLGGIPVKNVENLITNLLGWVWPQMAAAYDNIWATGSKSDLAKSADLDTDIKNLYDGKHELTDDMAAELARLYEAGYKNAIIRDTPEKWTDADEEIVMDTATAQMYNDELQRYLKPMGEIMQSPEYAMATDEEKARMLARLYDYADDLAKGHISDTHELGTYSETVVDWLDRGMSWAQIASGNTGDNNRLVKYVEAGVSDDIAEEIMNALDELEPEYGFKSVTAKQKVQTIAYMQITESEKEKAMSVAFGANGEKAYNRYMIARKNNVLSADYADFLEKLDKIDVNGGNPAQVEFIEAVAKSGFNTDAAKEIWYTYWKSESPWG